jgi:hypothetical protein
VSDFIEWRLQVRADQVAQWRLLRHLVRQQVKRGSFPAPDEYDRKWTLDAVDDFIVELLEKKGVNLLLKTLERGTSQEHVERSLLRTIHNRLIDQAKGTETGKLRLRLRTVLPEDPRFVHVDEPEESWTLENLPTNLWQGDLDGLLHAALSTRGYSIMRWNTAGPTPAEVKKALWEVSAGILAWAKAAVRAQDLAATLRERFELLRPLQVSTLDKLPSDREPAAEGVDPAAQAAIRDVVNHVWSCLTPEEQAAVPHLAHPVAGWARSVGLRPMQAELVVERVKEKVRLIVPVDEDTPATITLLCERAAGRA